MSTRLGCVSVGLVAAAVAAGAAAPRQRPVLSPHEVHAFDVGGCHLSINYGRPSKRGRPIWGGLVRWGHWWMPGADQATILTTSKALAFDGIDVPAGDHTLYVLPDDSASELVINNQVGQFHTQYDPERNLGTTRLTMKHLDSPVEQMTFTVEAEGTGGRLVLSWDDRAYAAAFVVK